MLTILSRGKGTNTRIVTDFKVGSWIHLETPTAEEIETAARLLEVNGDTIRDTLDPYEVPRVEDEPEGAYIFIRYPDESGTTPILIVVTKSGILTVVQKANPILDAIAQGKHVLDIREKTRFVLEVIARIDERYAAALIGIRKDVNRKKMTPDRMTVNDIVEFASYEATANDFLDALIPQQSVVTRILSGKVMSVSDEEKEKIEDLVLSTNQLIESCRAVLKTMVNLRSAYTAISTERLNQVIRVLTALTLIIAVPTAITSFYGMNVKLPGMDNPHAASFIGWGLAAAVLSLTWYFSKKRWL